MSASAEVVDIDAASLDARGVYRLLTDSVVPRPIAWITTRGPHGINVAPFSCYTFVSSVPPMLAISCGRRGNAPKDTVAHALREGEFVVNVVGAEFLLAMHASSGNFAPEVSEVELLGLETTPSGRVNTPGIRGVPVRMECRTDQVLEFGALKTQLLIGEVLHFQVRADCLTGRGGIDVDAARPVGRIGGSRYARLGELVTLAPAGATFQPPADRAR